MAAPLAIRPSETELDMRAGCDDPMFVAPWPAEARKTGVKHDLLSDLRGAQRFPVGPSTPDSTAQQPSGIRSVQRFGRGLGVLGIPFEMLFSCETAISATQHWLSVSDAKTAHPVEEWPLC
jgi:hypothetical protein